MKKFIIRVDIKDNAKFGFGNCSLKFLVFCDETIAPIAYVTNYLKENNIGGFHRVMDITEVTDTICLDDIDYILK